MNQRLSAVDITYCALFAALTAVLSYIRIPLPFSPVPVTLQTLAVMLAGSLLPPKTAFLCMVVYISMGIAGLPVFSAGAAGLGALIGPTGGYIMSWPIAAYIIAFMLRKRNPTFLMLILSNILGGIIVVYTAGTFYLALITDMDITAAVTAGALPFIPGDLLKVLAASLLSSSLRKSIIWKT
ncbi:MAG: biotin transporter BioY [Thermosediminibacteraceae bacterium]|nr:biotin transporter BioY [Thermosediminibacteraceae bacterium]